MKDVELERWLTQMKNTASAVGIAGDTYTQQIREMLEDESLDLQGAPSKASLIATFPLRRIEKNLMDINHTFEKLKEYIWEHYNTK